MFPKRSEVKKTANPAHEAGQKCRVKARIKQYFTAKSTAEGPTPASARSCGSLILFTFQKLLIQPLNSAVFPFPSADTGAGIGFCISAGQIQTGMVCWGWLKEHRLLLQHPPNQRRDWNLMR